MLNTFLVRLISYLILSSVLEGYGMPMLPHYQPNHYMEPPSFVMPHTHLHLMDYRRMLNPQYYQTMAYHTRRFRYQHNAPAREVTSSEVQTEPLSGSQRTSTPGSNTAEATGVQVCSDAPSVPAAAPLSPALVVQTADRSVEIKDLTPPCTNRTPPNGSFLIQTEEVRIECCTTPVGLQLVHSRETAEVSHSFSQDVVQCSSIVQGGVLQDDSQSEQSLQVCPDILLVGTPGGGEMTPEVKESKNQTDAVKLPFNTEPATCGEVEKKASEKERSVTSTNFPFKVVHLPFDPKYLEELQKMESTVWSVEDTLMPSPDTLIQNVHKEFNDEMLQDDVPPTLMLAEEAPTEEVVPMVEMPSLAGDEREGMASDAVCLMMDDAAAQEASELQHKAEATLVSDLISLDNSPLKFDKNQHREDTQVQSHQDTSFESLPAYLPSSSWLADFDNAYYYSKRPPTPRKQCNPTSKRGLDVPSRRRKLETEYKEQPTARKQKERYKPKGKVDRRSLSDHECCLSRNLSENSFPLYTSKRERLCSRCLAKTRIYTSASPGLNGRDLKKRKAVPFQQWNDLLSPTCDTCKAHAKKRLVRKGSVPDVRGPHHGHDTEGESSENSCCRKWRLAEDHRKLNTIKRPLASKQNLEKCPAVTNPKLREKNCACNEPQLHSAPWERLRHCPHGNAIREMDENCAMPISPQQKWRNMDQIYLSHRWQTGKHRLVVS